MEERKKVHSSTSSVLLIESVLLLASSESPSVSIREDTLVFFSCSAVFSEVVSWAVGLSSEPSSSGSDTSTPSFESPELCEPPALPLSGDGGRASSLLMSTGESSDRTLDVGSDSAAVKTVGDAGALSASKSFTGGVTAGGMGDVGAVRTGVVACGDVGDAGGGGMGAGMTSLIPAGLIVAVDEDICRALGGAGGNELPISRIIISPPASMSTRFGGGTSLSIVTMISSWVGR